MTIDKSIRQGYQWGGPGGKSPGTSATGGMRGETARETGIRRAAIAPAPAPQREERVSPIKSLVMIGDTSLAGKTIEEAERTVEAQNEIEGDAREKYISEMYTKPPVTTEEKVPDRVKQIITPPVTTGDDRVPDQIRDIITPPVTPRDDRDYKQFFGPKPLVEPPKKWYNNPLVKILAQPFLPEPLQRLLTAKTAATTMSDVFANTGLTKTNVARDFIENLSSKFASTGKPRETIDTKTDRDTIARGDGRQIEQPTVPEAIGKGEGLESGKKLLGLSEEETNYFKKLFASRDRKFLQSIFDKGTSRIQSGKATQKEKDVYTLLQQYLVDPKEGIMGVA